MSYNSKYKGSEVEKGIDLAYTAIQEHQDISHLATKEEIPYVPTKVSELENDSDYATQGQVKEQINAIPIPDVSGQIAAALVDYVKKVEGKGLSTNDFTNELKEKLEGITPYDPSELEAEISKLDTALNTLVGGNASNAIESFNEIIAFLKNVSDTESLSDIIAGINARIAEVEGKIPTKVSELDNDKGYLNEHQDISHLATKDELQGKQNVIQDLKAIREGASKGATALQFIPDEYVTESELDKKGYLTEHQDISHLATKDELIVIDIKATQAKSNADDALNQLMDLDSEVDKLANATYKNKGYYKTFDQLTTNVPTADIGCIAYVGISYPFDIYEWTETGWTTTGGTGGDFVLNLDNYYTKDEVAELFVKSSSVRELNTNYSPEALEKMKEEGMLDENVFYFGFEEE